MRRPVSHAVFALLACLGGGCIDDEDAGLALESSESPLSSYRPMGFARVSATGTAVSSFNSAGGAIEITTSSPGSYWVVFRGLDTTVVADGYRGNAQVVAEGANPISCRVRDFEPTGPDLRLAVECYDAAGYLQATAFTVLFYREPMPSSALPWPTIGAYTTVRSSGLVDNLRDFNSSGRHNTVVRTSTGRYLLTIPNATGTNASFMVSAADLWNSTSRCGVISWASGVATIECRRPSGAPSDTTFKFSYSATGPAIDQQGAHARFTGTALDPAWTAGLGRFNLCSTATVSASRVGSLTRVTVAGDLGSWDDGPFRRASLATPYGFAGYCKVESLTASGVAPTSTATTTVRCYTPNGAVIGVPAFLFTHVTSDVSGPC